MPLTLTLLLLPWLKLMMKARLLRGDEGEMQALPDVVPSIATSRPHSPVHLLPRQRHRCGLLRHQGAQAE